MPKSLEELSAEARARLRNLEEGKRKGVDYETLRLLATAYVEAFHGYQIVKYGKVRTRLSVERMMR